MRKEIKIPSMGESIQEVTIGRFLKPTGSLVEENDEIVELETEKINQVLYAPIKGVVTWQAEEGQTVQIDSLIGFVDSEAQAKDTQKKEGKAEEKPKLEGEKIKREEKPQERKETKEEKKPLEDEKERVTATKGKKETRKKMTKIRKVIASRLVEALRQSAMLTTFNEVDMTTVTELRNRLKESFLQKNGVKLGLLSFFVKAAALALKEFPTLNAYIEGDEIVQREYCDIGIAVSTERGLVVPVVRNCDQISFPEIEKAIEGYAKKAREGGLNIEDLEGGSFTITNGGVFGSLLSTPILNPPQVGILGMHKIEKRAVVVDDQIVIRPMMYLALSYDHRLIDGKEAIGFLVKIKEILENPQLSI